MEQDSRRRTVDQIADRLRAEILRGEHLPGTLLPPERALSDELDVNRLTLRAAYAQLEAEGLLQARQGQGVVVLDYRERGSLELLCHLDLPGLDADGLALRRLVLSEVVAGAATHATFEDLADLDDRERAMHQPGLDEALFITTHEQFLRRLALAAGSLPLRMLFHSLERWLESRGALKAELMSDREAVMATQTALLNLVRGGSPEVARKAVRTALARIEGAALRRLEGASV